MVLTVGYDIDNLTDSKIKSSYKGEITTDHYGRKVPKHAHGTANLGRQTSSTQIIAFFPYFFFTASIASCNLLSLESRSASSFRSFSKAVNRAAQFSPFAALTGHEDAIQETARLTDSFVEMDESRKSQLDGQRNP